MPVSSSVIGFACLAPLSSCKEWLGLLLEILCERFHGVGLLNFSSLYSPIVLGNTDKQSSKSVLAYV